MYGYTSGQRPVTPDRESLLHVLIRKSHSPNYNSGRYHLECSIIYTTLICRRVSGGSRKSCGSDEKANGGIMTQSSAVWTILQRHVPKRQWVSLGEIYEIVQTHWTLDNEDLQVHASDTPRWKFTVRRLLETKKRTGSIQGRRSSEKR